MADQPALRVLADRLGIQPEYVDINGVLRPTSDATREALLAAMGIAVSSDAEARQNLAELEREEVERILPPVTVLRHGRRQKKLQIRAPAAAGERLEYQLKLREENGGSYIFQGAVRPRRDGGRMSLKLPTLSQGYHEARLDIAIGGRDYRVDGSLIVCPNSCVTVGELLGGRRLFGIWTQLYGLRSRSNWGVGDLSDLHELAEWAAEVGAVFLGINPLHALRNSGGDISPYNPLTRLFHNVLYIDIHAIPELAECQEAKFLLESPEYARALTELRATDRVDYEQVMGLKWRVLESLHTTFIEHHRGFATDRGVAYRRFLKRGGQEVTDFATFQALDRHFRHQGIYDWRRWPEEYRNPRSAAVELFRRENLEEVDLHRYLQFELDRQLGIAASQVALAGLPIGLYGDLAIGSAPNGCDSWAFPGLFLDGVHLGAPPDDYSADGQNWGLPPADPRQLQLDRYRYWILLIRSALQHFGALRIDHVMGLFRQFWVPAGRSAREGAYVRYPASDLLGILALESRRNGALIIGEDLGTVPRGLGSRLARRGILSSRVLYFERDSHGDFKGSRRYSRRALVTVNTHDHPPLAGYWEGRDLELRRNAGDIDSDQELAAARERRADERRALLRRLAAESCLEVAQSPTSFPELSAAVHQFLARTPAPLLGVRLEDLTAETDPVNLPGIGLNRYPSWSSRMGTNVEDLAQDPDVNRALVGLKKRQRPAGWITY